MPWRCCGDGKTDLRSRSHIWDLARQQGAFFTLTTWEIVIGPTICSTLPGTSNTIRQLWSWLFDWGKTIDFDNCWGKTWEFVMDPPSMRFWSITGPLPWVLKSNVSVGASSTVHCALPRATSSPMSRYVAGLSSMPRGTMVAIPRPQSHDSADSCQQSVLTFKSGVELLVKELYCTNTLDEQIMEMVPPGIIRYRWV